MKAKLMICASALVIGSAIYCMEKEEIFKVQDVRDRLPALEKNETQILDELLQEDIKRLDDKMFEEDESKPEPSAKEKILNALKSKYDSLPPQIKMVTDKAAEHPRVAGAIGFAAAEGCSWWCCPGFAYAANLLLAGYATRIVHTEITKKQSDILKKNK